MQVLLWNEESLFTQWSSNTFVWLEHKAQSKNLATVHAPFSQTVWDMGYVKKKSLSLTIIAHMNLLVPIVEKSFIYGGLQ